MRVLASSVLIGAAAAAITPQQVLQQPLQAVQEASKKLATAWQEPLHGLKEHLDSLGADARAAWDDVAMMFPEAMEAAMRVTPPKKHTRRPDSHWDHILEGADVQKVWVENANGEKEREIEGKLENYRLRAKKPDPSKLGVDPGVKQYSGYLDDDENDKHLFYCEISGSFSS